MTALTYPAISEIERIAALTEPRLRNLQITQCYHELALALAQRTGRSANWCTFATWASKQAGQTIRKEDLARSLEAALGSEAAARQTAQGLSAAIQGLGISLGVDRLLEVIGKAYDPQAAFERSSAAVARGNLKVFAEIAAEFARFYAACLADQQYDPAHIARFCESLRPGEPPDGQRYLQQAFRRYYRALFEESAKARAELLLLANLEIGFHEQTRLQPEINAALAAPVISPQEFVRNLLKVLHPHGGWRKGAEWFFLRLFGRLTELDTAMEAFVAWAERQVQFLVTETLMTIELPPRRKLRLGDDLAAGFPPALRRIANPELQALLARIDPTPDSTRQSGAVFWGDLPDRMHFIADMFRCYELSAELLAAPFNDEQTADIKAGRLPEGRL
jgi:hypothetical protein